MDDAYELLKKAKGKNESFSDVIRRDYSKKKTMKEFFGAWKDLPVDDIKKVISDGRELSRKRKVLEF